MPFCCEKCKKTFRDRYDLNRHLLKKNPCILTQEFLKNDTKIINIINNGTINIHFVLGNDDLSGIDPERIINEWRTINKTTEEEYTRAGKLVTTFHSMVCENPINHNIKIKNERSISGVLLEQNGEWKLSSTDEIVDRVIKVRSGQLIQFKESITQTNDRVFKVPSNQRTWKHLENFSFHGRDHQGSSHDQTRRLRNSVKVALIN
jgi:hypothetical protein